ncbi:MAG: M81 family metallopeptidase [Burkholderiales bacterium]|jgi:microcystin degradation protein MlrC|nr:M81 family metallopeptidase [Burkholderiales bacterium]
MKICIGGFQHETNTFAPSPATWDDFARGGGWPPLQRGADLFDGVAGINLPITGFVDAMRARRDQLVPTAWAAASPSAHVTRDAYERIAAMIVGDIAAARPDAVYLDLHGAMVTEHLDDGEGELLARIRAVTGPRVPIVASLDLHANVTARMIANADAFVAYRTYPHVDMADTGAAAAALLERMLRDGAPRPAMAHVRIPFLIPLVSQCTMLEPLASLYASLPAREGSGVWSVSFTPGFPAADFPECGPVAIAVADTRDAAERAARQLAHDVAAIERDFVLEVLSPEAGVQRALRTAAAGATRPTVIADAQDNPGAGGDSNTTGMLRALLDARAPRASLGLMADPEVARAAHAAGVGATLTLPLGGKSKVPGDAPLEAPWVVERLSDGRLVGTGPFYRGARMQLGPCACLRIGGVRVIVSCEKPQLADQEMYRFIGIEPTAEAILVNKSSVHFRADFAPIAEEILVCKAPGPMLADPAEFPWQRLGPDTRFIRMGR